MAMTDGDRVGTSGTHAPGPHFHNPPSADDLARVAMLKESGDTPTAEDIAFLNRVRTKADLTGDVHTVAVIDDLLGA